MTCYIAATMPKCKLASKNVAHRKAASSNGVSKATSPNGKIEVLGDLSIAKMLSGWNAFEISDIQDLQLSRPNPAIMM